MKTAEEIIENAVKTKNRVLCEDDAKKVLNAFSIPVVQEKRVSSAREAAVAAKEFGFPVVLKGLGTKLLHKSELGMVKTGLTSDHEVNTAAEEIINKGGDSLEALLVQPMVQGRREFVAGMFKDPQFGPVIMFGLGGVFTEALNDAAFRIAPLEEVDMNDMVDELSSKALLREFRGEKKADMVQIKAVLSGLSHLAAEFPMISEVDINPLIIDSEGSVKAVDALIVIEKKKEKKRAASLIDKKILGALFYPESVAFVGASATLGKWGHMLLTNTLSGGYEGNVYFVNPGSDKIAGRQVYPSLADIEGSIDLAVVTIPADKVMDLIPVLQKKRVKGMLLITSGFRETGKQGAALEQKLVRAAKEAGIIILGPNTMGICNPHKKFYCKGAHVHPLPGSTALVCQSGNLGTQLLAFAYQQGIGIRAFSGSGNEAMVTIEDYMEVFEHDKKTSTVVLYLESVKDGQRFFRSASRVSSQKPVVVLKGGRTRAGGKAASSHTGAMAANAEIFDSACRQAGIIHVQQPMELLDLSAVFSSLPLPKGNRVAIMTLGGGWGVVTADLCMEYGLELPDLSEDITAKLDTMLPSYWSRANPVDIVGENDAEIPMVTVEELLKWEGCDAVIHLGIHGKRIFIENMVDSISEVDLSYSRESLEMVKDQLIQFEDNYVEHVARLAQTYEKPVLGVSLLADDKTRILYRFKNCKYKGVFFPSPERAVKALAGMWQYSSWLKKHSLHA
ncbi:MAG: acetate--CoA ligase family protein [Thermodesulfobacteriota bacterium]|nr:acetate--CoA ligase family protein [Thermodesulfobacteriota bacterium]